MDIYLFVFPWSRPEVPCTIRFPLCCTLQQHQVEDSTCWLEGQLLSIVYESFVPVQKCLYWLTNVSTSVSKRLSSGKIYSLFCSVLCSREGNLPRVLKSPGTHPPLGQDWNQLVWLVGETRQEKWTRQLGAAELQDVLWLTSRSWSESCPPLVEPPSKGWTPPLAQGGWNTSLCEHRGVSSACCKQNTWEHPPSTSACVLKQDLWKKSRQLLSISTDNGVISSLSFAVQHAEKKIHEETWAVRCFGPIL